MEWMEFVSMIACHWQAIMQTFMHFLTQIKKKQR